MRSEPFAEVGNQRRFHDMAAIRAVTANAAILKVSVKQLNSEARMIPSLAAVRVVASASWQMLDEGVQHTFVCISQCSSAPLNEHSEMGCGTYIADNARMCIAIGVEGVGKAVDVCCAETSTQPTQSLW